MCNKVKFSKIEAASALKHGLNKHKKYRREVRMYNCPDCNYWHLTSKEEFALPEETELIFKNKWEKLIK